MSGNNESSHGPFRCASWSQRREGLSIASTLLLCAGLLLGIPDGAYADSIASSTISFSNIQITLPTGNPGSIVWQGAAPPGTSCTGVAPAWCSQAYAEPQNGLGEDIPVFTSNTGAASTASATVTFANASGTADVSSLSGTASGNASILGTTAQAITSSTSSLSNSFEITGGTGSVDVAFSTDFNGQVQVANDQNGVQATAEAIFNLNLDGSPVLSFDSPISVGSSASLVSPFGQTLTNTVPLNFDTSYPLFIQADAETSAYNVPEYPSVVLLTIGLLAMAAYAYAAERRSALRSAQGKL
ncbi:MAG TPA: hypothetical protein VKM93_22175 [Terriglobia bacterium]|nr:hypothetical protein [Terriglobia bacterium]